MAIRKILPQLSGDHHPFLFNSLTFQFLFSSLEIQMALVSIQYMTVFFRYINQKNLSLKYLFLNKNKIIFFFTKMIQSNTAYQLDTQFSSGTLQVTIKDKNKQKNYVYSLKDLTQISGLSDWFDTIEGFGQYLKQENRYKFNIETGLLSIFAKHPTKAAQNIEIARIPMQLIEVQEIIMEKSIQWVLQKCHSSQQLTQKEIKEMIFLLANENSSKARKDSKMEVKDILSKEQFQKQLQNLSEVMLSKIQNIHYPKQDNGNEIQKRNSINIERLQNELRQKDEVVQVIIAKIRNYSDERDQRMDKMQDRIQALENKIKQFQRAFEDIQGIRRGSSSIDPNCLSFNKIKISGNSVTKILGTEADIFYKTKIIDKNKFIIKIDHLKEWMCVGVADSRLKTKQSFTNQPYCIVYYSDGNFYNGRNLSGKIFKKYGPNDIITVSVNVELGKVDFVIGSQLRVSYTYNSIKDSRIQWVPYVWLLSDGDSFTVLQ